MTGPGIGEFLSEISPDDIQKFLYLWLKNLNDDKFLFYDITSISSYEKSNFIARRGYNHDHEKLEQINLSLLFGQHSMLPAHYRITRGNMDDVSTMEKTFEYLNFLDIKHPTYVLGRDFHGKDNVSPLLEKDFKFVMPLPPNQFWVETIIDSYHDAIKLPDNHHKINDGESIFAIKQHINYFDSGRRLYLHIYHQPEKKDNDFKVLIENTTKLKEQIESGEIPDQFLIENYKQFLIVSKRGHKEYSVEYDDDKILKHKDGYCGFFCVLSPNIKDSLEALAIYGNKHKVEKSFDDIKNSSDVKRLGIHKELRFEARLFIQFISLIFTSKLRAMTKGATNGIRYLSVDDIFDCLKMLQKTEFKGKYVRIFNEPDRQTKKILDFFGINRPPR
jgi:transposase